MELMDFLRIGECEWRRRTQGRPQDSQLLRRWFPVQRKISRLISMECRRGEGGCLRWKGWFFYPPFGGTNLVERSGRGMVAEPLDE